MISAETRRYLRIFKEEVFPEADPEPRAALHDRLRAAPADGEPGARMVALVSLAHAGKVLPKQLPKESRRRAAELAVLDPVGELVARPG
ncbi:GPP34 family phosphoprotein [Nonomuraea sp. NPDC046802]|uniref:GPP34 family phosphoprotein n=1 Tax=Nonomuraea sp. NPDC046802 TaxID=3154919 RepID=UPI0033F78132